MKAAPSTTASADIVAADGEVEGVLNNFPKVDGEHAGLMFPMRRTSPSTYTAKVCTQADHTVSYATSHC